MARPRFPGAQAYLPEAIELDALEDAVQGCRGCDLYERATQAVFGEGHRASRLLLVGEQPGDREDEAGEPFVGPAGQMLDKALADAGIDRDDAYVTNAVKHFRWKPAGTGKRRIHEKPSLAQMVACRPWLEAEVEAVQPRVLVALGATAAGSLIGTTFRLTQHRGEAMPWPPDGWGPGTLTHEERQVVATFHPAAVLRARAPERDEMYAGLVADLRLAGRLATTA